MQGSHESWKKTLKRLENKPEAFQAWKSLEIAEIIEWHGKSLEITEILECHDKSMEI